MSNTTKTTKTVLIGDIHLSKKFPYTTGKTQQKFDQIRTEIVSELVDKASQAARWFQLGDLFDGHNISAETLIEGYRFISGAGARGAVLSGNHDKSNNILKASGLGLLSSHLSPQVVWEDVKTYAEGYTEFFLVPHNLSQEGFEKSLDLAVECAASSSYHFKVLLLHCNFGDREGSNTENYLRRDRARQLLGTFNWIFSGHEHNKSTPMPGVVMVGSVLPYSFGEMTPKVYVEYDNYTGKQELNLLWSPEQGYLKLSAQEFLLISPDSELPTAYFLEVEGEASIEEQAQVHKKIAELYKNESVVAIKNSVRLTGTVHQTEEEVEQASENWKEIIRKECTKEQLDLFNDLMKELNNAD
jgi:DNA repair exonuclease SbcCD nuclease subunit